MFKILEVRDNYRGYIRIYKDKSRLILKCAGPENGGGGDDGRDGGGNNDQDPYSRAERLYQDIVKARTNDEFYFFWFDISFGLIFLTAI